MCLTFIISHMLFCMLIWAACIKGVYTGGVSPATHVILHRWQDTMPSRQQGLPETEEEARKSYGGWERVITKRVNMKENLKMKGGLAKVGAAKSDLSKSEGETKCTPPSSEAKGETENRA